MLPRGERTTKKNIFRAIIRRRLLKKKNIKQQKKKKTTTTKKTCSKSQYQVKRKTKLKNELNTAPQHAWADTDLMYEKSSSSSSSASQLQRCINRRLHLRRRRQSI